MYKHYIEAESVQVLVDALEELVELVEDYCQGEYIIDSLTAQPARTALTTFRGCHYPRKSNQTTQTQENL